MNKQEFIDRLRMALSGKVSAGLVEENVSYYEDYINSQMRMGASEEKVLSELGDPRLIAKSIITANERDFSENTSGNTRADDTNQETYAQKRPNSSLRVAGLPGWAVLLIVLLIFVVIISIIWSIISALLPAIVPILLVVFLIKLFRDWLN